MDKEKRPGPSQVILEERSAVIQESEATQMEKGDCILPGTIIMPSELGKVDFEQNDLALLKETLQRMRRHEDFVKRYGYIACLISVPVNIPMLKAMLHFWDPYYRCFTFNQFDMVPTIEEYYKLLNVEAASKEKIYQYDQRKTPRKTLSKLIGVQASDLEKHMKEKGQSLSAEYLVQFVQGNVDTDRGLSALALAIYGLVIFPRVKGQIDGQVIKLFEQIEHKTNPAIPILAESIRSLNHCRFNKKGRFRSCAQLLTIWMISHLPTLKNFDFPNIKWNMYNIGFSNPVGAYASAKWPDTFPMKSQWVNFFLSLKEVVWRAPWLPHTYAIYRCGNKPWVPLIGPWGITSYAPAMVRRQLGSKQFVPMTHGLSEFEFSYGDDATTKKIKEAIEAWKIVRYVKQGASMETTAAYPLWQAERRRGFVAPKVEGPDPPIHIFDKPIDYKVEAEGRYEAVYRQYIEREAMLALETDKISGEKKVWAGELERAKKEIRDKETSATLMQQEMRRLNEKCRALEAIIEKKDTQFIALHQENEALQLNVGTLNSNLENAKKTIAQKQEENASLKDECIYWENMSRKFEEQGQQLMQKSCDLLEDVQKVAERARKRAREVQEIEVKMPPSEVQEFLAGMKKDLDHLGKFH